MWLIDRETIVYSSSCKQDRYEVSCPTHKELIDGTLLAGHADTQPPTGEDLSALLRYARTYL